MNTRTLFAIVALGALVLLPGLAVSQEEGGAPMDQAKMMELWKKYATPGEQHRELAWFVGTWDTETRMMGPLAEKGVATFRWVLDGRWLGQEFKGTMMGQPLEGFGQMGYDLFAKKWIMSWVDTTSTLMWIAEGPVCDPTGRTVSLYGEIDEFMTGECDKPFRWTIRRQDEDKFTFEIWDLGVGATGQKVAEVTYTRRKAE